MKIRINKILCNTKRASIMSLQQEDDSQIFFSFYNILFQFVPLYSILLHSIPHYSIPFYDIILCSVLFPFIVVYSVSIYFASLLSCYN